MQCHWVSDIAGREGGRPADARSMRLRRNGVMSRARRRRRRMRTRRWTRASSDLRYLTGRGGAVGGRQN
eukprot:7809879-Pyramimonas_sp.AAC.1